MLLYAAINIMIDNDTSYHLRHIIQQALHRDDCKREVSISTEKKRSELEIQTQLQLSCLASKSADLFAISIKKLKMTATAGNDK